MKKAKPSLFRVPPAAAATTPYTHKRRRSRWARSTLKRIWLLTAL
jgi:hypothetical protein